MSTDTQHVTLLPCEVNKVTWLHAFQPNVQQRNLSSEWAAQVLLGTALMGSTSSTENCTHGQYKFYWVQHSWAVQVLLGTALMGSTSSTGYCTHGQYSSTSSTGYCMSIRESSTFWSLYVLDHASLDTCLQTCMHTDQTCMHTDLHSSRPACIQTSPCAMHTDISTDCHLIHDAVAPDLLAAQSSQATNNQHSNPLQTRQ